MSNKDNNKANGVNDNQNWCVYMIETRSGKLYTGISNHLERRCKQHINGSGAKYFRFDKPLFLVWSEFEHNRSSASKRESALKKLSRNQKIALISSNTKIVL